MLSTNESTQSCTGPGIEPQSGQIFFFFEQSISAIHPIHRPNKQALDLSPRFFKHNHPFPKSVTMTVAIVYGVVFFMQHGLAGAGFFPGQIACSTPLKMTGCMNLLLFYIWSFKRTSSGEKEPSKLLQINSIFDEDKAC